LNFTIRLKLLEETYEVIVAKDCKELLRELAVLYEVIDSIAVVRRIQKMIL